MHGAGNDYVYVDGRREKVRNAARLAVEVSDRHTGIGSDGLILIQPSKSADFRMEMYNADGSEGSMCGNGIRCIGKYVYEHGLTRSRRVEIETRGGNVNLELHVRGGRVDEVTVAMGTARPIPRAFHRTADGRSTAFRAEVAVDGRRFVGTVVSMGNPHFVIEVEDPTSFPVERYGPLIEKHPDFPSRVNVEFVKALSRRRAVQRTWERGSGETWACGSGACAVAVALHRADRVGRDVAIDLRGGTLRISLAADGDVRMRGPAVEVFTGDWPTRQASGR
jgi:diaminopimelate epimerase